MDFSIIAIVIQLIFLEGILSIDNAAILGAMVTPLSSHEPIPWPNALKGVSHVFDRLLGHQRGAALRVGLLGAYVGRGLMLLAASYIIHNPWLKLVGAAYLIKLAIDDLSAHGFSGMEDEAVRPVKVRTFWATVLAVELMDLAFSSGGSGSVAMSVQELSMTTTGVTLQAQPGFDLVNLRTGDVMIDGAGAMSGIQAQTINSGIGSSVTAAVSIAAHAVQFGTPKAN